MDPSLLETHTLLLRNDYNGANTAVAEIVVTKLLDNILRNGNGFEIFRPGLDEIIWTDPEWVDDIIRDVLFDDEGMPRIGCCEDEFWRLLKDPSPTILDYSIEVYETIEGLVAANRDVLNNVIETYIVDNVEVVDRLPTHILLTFKGAQTHDNTAIRSPKTEGDECDVSSPPQLYR